jgi:hypothetical protein
MLAPEYRTGNIFYKNKKTFFTKRESRPKFQAEFFGQALHLI